MNRSGKLRDVLAYFDVTAARFDAIYSAPQALDRIFRRDMYERFQRTLAACYPISGKSALDVGCGSGQYSVALAQRGADEVIGLDFAPNMLTLATEHARRAGVADRCRFLCGEFLSHRFDRRFDYLIAIGLFDYVEDPLPFLIRARELTTTKVIATFPRLLTWRAPVRKIRLMLGGCPVYFYSRDRVVTLLQRAGLAIEKLERCGKLHWVAARPVAAEKCPSRETTERPVTVIPGTNRVIGAAPERIVGRVSERIVKILADLGTDARSPYAA